MKTILLGLLGILLNFEGDTSRIEEDITRALENSKKGIYWALTQIPEKKSKIENDLIADDVLCSSVRVEKQINGIMIESTGYYLSNIVTIRIYKSFDSLEKEGYIRKGYN